MKLLLFDVDGTLLRSGGAGMRAVDRVVHERYGVERASAGVVPDGKTDPIIFREVLVALGDRVVDLEQELRALLSRYAEVMAEEMAVATRARLMPGVEALLVSLERRDGVLLGLLTGNLEATARLKLDRFGLNRFFPVGAFASDDERRERLVPIAVNRAERHAARPIGLGPHVMVIGDTPRDVACALVNGVAAVGVGAARYSAQELADAGATLVFPSLADTPAVLSGLGL